MEKKKERKTDPRRENVWEGIERKWDEGKREEEEEEDKNGLGDEERSEKMLCVLPPDVSVLY